MIQALTLYLIQVNGAFWAHLEECHKLAKQIRREDRQASNNFKNTN